MSKVITLEILLENTRVSNLSVTYEVKESIFTEYDRQMDYEIVKSLVKKSLAKMGDFNMITATLMIRTMGDYSPYTSKNILQSFRYVNSYGDIKFSKFIDNSYPDFTPSEKKTIYPNIKRLVETANAKFIEILRIDAKETAA